MDEPKTNAGEARAAQMRDRRIEDWLRTQVSPVYDATMADPGRTVPARDVFDEIRVHHAYGRKGL